MDWFGDNWGNLASVLGVVVSVVGFILAVYQILKTRAVAEAAKTAADNARAALSKSITIGDLDRASERIERIKTEISQGRIDIAKEHLLDIMRMLADVIGRAREADESELEKLVQASDTIADLTIMTLEDDFTGIIADLTSAQQVLLALRVDIEQKEGEHG